MIEWIKRWVVVMFENRSFDSLLGHLPHIDAEDGIREREIVLPYPGGSVRVQPSVNFTDPIPDPGEGYPNVNVQLFGAYLPSENAGKAAYPIFPNSMTAPFNAPADVTSPSMDGFALDFYCNSQWQTGRALSDQEMQSIGRVFTPRTAPVINALAQQYGVFTHWHADVPSCTFPNRTFFHAGTSHGRVDNDITYDYAWDNDLPNLFERMTDRGVDWKCYYDKSQVVPLTAINLAGARHLGMWRDHTVHLPEFFSDCAQGRLPTYSWVEPNMLFGNLTDYHPPTDVRAGEWFLAQIYNAVRTSPQWDETALVIMFDEHGGCYDHVPPPSAIPPGDGAPAGEEGFRFDRYGVRVPTLVVSAHTKRGTVLRELHSNVSMTRTLREHLDLGSPLSLREAEATTIEAAFNRSDPRKDMHQIDMQPYVPGQPNPHAQQPVKGDLPDAALLLEMRKAQAGEFVSQLGEATLRNAARLLRQQSDALPETAKEGRHWLAHRFVHEGRFSIRR